MGHSAPDVSELQPHNEVVTPTTVPATADKPGCESAGDKARPRDRRANALRHGLTAAKFVPAALQLPRLGEIKLRLRDEFRPTTLAQELLIHEAARHFAFLEVIEQAEPAVLRQAAHSLSTIVACDGSAVHDDLQLAAAVTAEPLERVARYRRAHEKGLFRALEWLERSNAHEPSVARAGNQVLFESFATEEACEGYLKRYIESTGWCCPRCRGTNSHWLAARKRWECVACQAQTGLRAGAVFARSRLPLKAWFRAIRAYVANTSLTASALADLAEITRLATARAVLRRLQQAVADGETGKKFAGLEAYPLRAAPN
jgi:hypothetical protein